jgi:putative DNA primase/helicase
LTKYQKAIMFVGSGANGKSVMIMLIGAFVGEDNCSHVGLHELSNNRFLAAELFGKLVNAYPDLPSEGLEDTALFKSLVSGDYIQAEKKHRDPFSFRNHAKLIFSANRIPKTDDPTFAYLRRWVILPFEQYFADDQRDEDLIDKLATEDELSGLLNLALKGRAKLIAEKGFRDTSIEVVREEYEYQEEIVGTFILRKCVRDSKENKTKYYILENDLLEAFHKYCRKEENIADKDLMTKGKFQSELLKRGIIAGRVVEDGKKKHCYRGIITTELLDKKSREELERHKQSTL